MGQRLDKKKTNGPKKLFRGLGKKEHKGMVKVPNRAYVWIY